MTRSPSKSQKQCKDPQRSEIGSEKTYWVSEGETEWLIFLEEAKLLHSPGEQLTSLTGSFGYVAPEVIKNTGHGKPVDIWSTGNLASIRPRKRIRLIISLHSHHHLRPTLWIPPFRADNTTALTQQTADPKVEFQSPYWNPVSEQAKSFIRCLATVHLLHRPTAQEALPWLTPILITADMPSHADLSPTLRQNWSPRAKWHSALTGIRAANRFSYFAAAASRSSTQSSGGWDDVVDPNPPVTQFWRRRRTRRMLVKMILCLVLLRIESRRSLGQR